MTPWPVYKRRDDDDENRQRGMKAQAKMNDVTSMGKDDEVGRTQSEMQEDTDFLRIS